jgi:DcuC family C4-dicarboxylate transporter
MSRGGDLGMMIMMLCGFAAYMTHIGANDMVVKLASNRCNTSTPLSADDRRLFPRLPDVTGRLFCHRSWRTANGDAVPGHGQRRYQPRRGRYLRSPAAIILSPTSGDVVLAAKAAEMSLIDFAFKTTLPISIAAIIAMAIAHFFWQRYLDKKENISHEMLDVVKSPRPLPPSTPFCLLHRLSAC